MLGEDERADEADGARRLDIGDVKGWIGGFKEAESITGCHDHVVKENFAVSGLGSFCVRECIWGCGKVVEVYYVGFESFAISKVADGAGDAVCVLLIWVEGL